MKQIIVAPVCKLEKFNHLYIELTEKNCNQRCKKCYIDFPFNKNIKDFIHIDKIKQALNDTLHDDLQCIYLTGAEPMTHPDFNNILRLCLKRTNVCIFTNASFINEKKVRFLKKVENESKYQIFFKLSFASFDEMRNDTIRFRGAFRQNMYALRSLDKENFTTILCINNYYKDDETLIKEEFSKILNEHNIKNGVIQITKWIDKKDSCTSYPENLGIYDCSVSRTLTSNGIYACPYLANDYRGRQGMTFKDYSKSIRLESEYCIACIKNSEPMLSVNVC